MAEQQQARQVRRAARSGAHQAVGTKQPSSAVSEALQAHLATAKQEMEKLAAGRMSILLLPPQQGRSIREQLFANEKAAQKILRESSELESGEPTEMYRWSAAVYYAAALLRHASENGGLPDGDEAFSVVKMLHQHHAIRVERDAKDPGWAVHAEKKLWIQFRAKSIWEMDTLTETALVSLVGDQVLPVLKKAEEQYGKAVKGFEASAAGRAVDGYIPITPSDFLRMLYLPPRDQMKKPGGGCVLFVPEKTEAVEGKGSWRRLAGMLYCWVSLCDVELEGLEGKVHLWSGWNVEVVGVANKPRGLSDLFKPQGIPVKKLSESVFPVPDDPEWEKGAIYMPLSVFVKNQGKPSMKDPLPSRMYLPDELRSGLSKEELREHFLTFLTLRRALENLQVAENAKDNFVAQARILQADAAKHARENGFHGVEKDPAVFFGPNKPAGVHYAVLTDPGTQPWLEMLPDGKKKAWRDGVHMWLVRSKDGGAITVAGYPPTPQALLSKEGNKKQILSRLINWHGTFVKKPDGANGTAEPTPNPDNKTGTAATDAPVVLEEEPAPLMTGADDSSSEEAQAAHAADEAMAALEGGMPSFQAMDGIVEEMQTAETAGSESAGGDVEEAPASEEPSSVKTTRAVRNLALDLGVDIALVTGTGKDGYVTKADIRAYVGNRG